MSMGSEMIKVFISTLLATVVLLSTTASIAQNVSQCVPTNKIEELRTQHADQLKQYLSYLQDRKMLSEQLDRLLDAVQRCQRQKLFLLQQ